MSNSATSLLLVDDSQETRLALCHMLTEWGYHVLPASNGDEAWAILQRDQPRIVICDWVMPGLDGPSLCAKIRTSSQQAYVYLILLTSHVDSECLVQGMSVGVDDFVTKPVTLDDYHILKARIRAAERITELWQSLQDQYRRQVELSNQLAIANEKLRRELESAGQMQRRLLPREGSLVHDYQFEWIFIPSAVLSGDMLGFFAIDENHAGFYCIDVAGHGVAASMMSANLNQLMTPEMDDRRPVKKRCDKFPYYWIPSPTQVVSDLNRMFQMSDNHHQYFTMVYGVLDRRSHTLDLCIAGTPHPAFLPLNQPAFLLGQGGFPVGLQDKVQYESTRISYQPGDRLILYSDGITECRGRGSEMFGVDRILNILNGSHHKTLKQTLDSLEYAVTAWRTEPDIEDDISILGVEFS